MATIITHPVIPMAVGVGLGSEVIPIRAVLAGIFLSVAPDLDVISFRLGIPYSHMLGHRGLSHSILFALLLAILFTLILKIEKKSRAAVLIVLFISTLSHGLLDAMTNGGLGIAFFAPFSNTRYFFPWQVLQVSPIGLGRFLTPRGPAVLHSELVWVWIPALISAYPLFMVRRWLVRNQKHST